VTGPIGLGYSGLSSTATLTPTAILSTSQSIVVNLLPTQDAFGIGDRVRFASLGVPTSYFEGIVTGYDAFPHLTLTVDQASGSSPRSDWVIGLTGNQGVTGPTGPAGPTGPTGATGPSLLNAVGTATLNFGAATSGQSSTSVTVPDAGAGAGSIIAVFFMADSTVDHNGEEHRMLDQFSDKCAGTIVPGVGFNIYCDATLRVRGTFLVHYMRS
jgi:hypothetical protein